MTQIDFGMPATIHLGDEPNLRGSQQLVLSNFETAAEAIRFVVERLPRDLQGTRIMSATRQWRGDQIRQAYDGPDFPRARGR